MNQAIITTHAVLIGLTPLIPVPGLDDLVKGYFYRRLIKSLAAAYGAALSEGEIAALAEDRGPGCLNGCLFGLFEYLVKRLIRKVVFILEWRRAIDLATHAYYYGHLLDYAFGRGWHTPGDPASATRLRAAIEQARASANTSLVKRAMQSGFNQSRGLLLNAVQLISGSVQDIAFRRSRIWVRRALATRLRRWVPRLSRWLYSRARPAEADQIAQAENAVAQKMDEQSPRLQTTLGGLIAQIQASITALPDDHFDELENRLAKALGV